MKNSRLLIMVSCLSLLFFTLSCENKKQQTEEAVSKTSPQNANWGDAPDFTLKKIDGSSFTLSSLKGKIIIIDFWISWCPICQLEMPHFVRLHKDYKKKGVEVVGICYDEDLVSAKQLIKKLELEYIVVMGNKELARTYKWRIGSPATFIIDRNGNKIEDMRGARTYKRLENAIKPLL